MGTHVVGTLNPDYGLLGDSAPTANADTASVAYNQQVTINALGNDTDPDVLTQDQLFLGVGEYTDPVITGTNTLAAGHLQVINNQFIFTADDPSFASGSTSITFSYTAVDQWGAESNWSTITVNITGNSTPGIVNCGTVHNDVMHDGAGNDYLYGNNGDDIMYSSSGNDILDGGNGKDHIYGGTGNDTLIGGAGNDTITAGSGTDVLIGGSAGDDHGNGHGCGPCGYGWNFGFDFGSICGPSNDHDTFILPANFSNVTIVDFSKNDSIDISPWVFQSFSQMMAHAHQQGCNVVISTPDPLNPATTHTLVLDHTSLWDLHSSQFTFV